MVFPLKGGKMTIQKITTSDTYEAAFYLVLGAAILGAELIEENKKKICIFSLSGENLTKAQQEYFNSKAYVNIWDFRRCLTRINSLVGSVKANEKKKSSQQEASK